MKEIPLTQGKVALVNDTDYEAVTKFKWHAFKNQDGNWYAARSTRKLDRTRTTQYLHQFLMPRASMVDHKNNNGLDNQRDNLRPCTNAENQMNRKPKSRGSSSFKGVTWNAARRKWQARVGLESKTYYLGIFSSEKDAAQAYDTAAKELYGEFARLNFAEV